MPLSVQEEQELAAIEQELAVRQGQQMPAASMPSGLSSDEENELMAIEQELARRQSAPVGVSPYEADLGFINRVRYSLEPLQSNRMALLAQQFGPENVVADEKGDVFIKQGNQYRPVNAPGASFADVTEFAGALPEMVGAGAGALVGMGPASIPGAAIGGAAGSAARQAMSALVGTPQVATPVERLTEVGTSAAFSAGGAAIGKGAKKIYEYVSPKLKSLLPSFKPDAVGRRMVDIAKRENIPAPTFGQIAGGRDLATEKALLERPLFGRGIRKQVNKQVEAIKSNLKNMTGDFIEAEGREEAAGALVKGQAQSKIKAIKDTASSLFDKIAKEGEDVVVDSQWLESKMLKNMKQFGMISDTGELIPHSSRSGLTEAQYSRLQGIFKKVLDDSFQSRQGLGKLSANSINTMRKFVDANIKEGGRLGYDDAILVKFRESLNDLTENMLEMKSPKLSSEFKQARALWHTKLDLEDKAKSLFGGFDEKSLSDEKVINRIFRDKKNVKLLRDLTDDNTVKEAGLTHLNNILRKKLGGRDQIGARSALNSIKEQSRAIIESVGYKNYKKIRDNLLYLDQIGASINPSRTFITELMTDLSPKALTTGTLQSLQRQGRIKMQTIGASSMRLPGNPRKYGSIANILGDVPQRESAYFTRGPQSLIGEQQNDKKDRRPSGR